jgi:glycosyltransferase involved in cell wall biosynthesis
MRSLPARARFMDMMDDFPAFYSGLSRISMQNTANDLMSQCDYFFCSEQSLIKKLNEHQLNKNIQLIPNGYDMRRLPSLSSSKPEQKVIGFVGTISTWFDWKLVIEIALALPHVKIMLIGPRGGEMPSELPCNIELLPACSVEDAIEHCQKFTVGLIPFVNSQLTESVDPIKYYELRALGIPIWTTSFGSMTDRLKETEVTQILSGMDWLALWNQVTSAAIDEEKIALFRKENDWDVRFEHMAEWLKLKHRNS